MHARLFSPRWYRAGIPTALTLSSMVCGCLSMTFALHGSFTAAAWLIVCGGVLDAIDGPTARALRVCTDFGRELDSFADLVTFGIAPAFLFYRAYFMSWGAFGAVLFFFPPAMAAIRLSRYNTACAGSDRAYFTGLTSTAAGNLLASYLLFSHDVWGGYSFPGIAATLSILSSALMVSKIHYRTISRLTRLELWRSRAGIVCMVAVSCLLLFPAKFFFPAMTALMLEGPLSHPIGEAARHVGDIIREHRAT